MTEEERSDGAARPFPGAGGKLRFSAFEVDLLQRELRKRGVRIHLQEQPFKILELLLAARGRLVTRKELAAALWPSLHVSVDQSLNTAVNALRNALGDSSKSCRFIETRAGLGYCFLVPIEEISPAEDLAPRIVPVPIAGSGARSSLSQDYRKGRHFYERFTKAALLQSIAYFESVINHDPREALAYAGLADAHASLAALNALPPAEAHVKSHAFLSRALDENANSAEVQVSAGLHLRTFHRDWSGSASALARALQLDPGCAAAHREQALTCAARGSFEDALRSASRAVDLAPVSLANNCALAWVFYVGGHASNAYEQCWKTLALDASLPLAQYTLALACEQLGLIDEAIAEFENARVCWNDNPAAIAGLAHVYAAAGMQAEAGQLSRELERLAAARYVSPYWLSLAHAGSGNADHALNALEQSFNEDDVCLVWIDSDPRLKPLRSHARFKKLAPSANHAARSTSI